MILICRADADEYQVGCDYAIAEVSDDLLLRIAELVKHAAAAHAEIPAFYTLSCWDASLDYLDAVPVEWEEWLEDLEHFEWAELPFPYDRNSSSDEPDGLHIRLGRTECDQMHASNHGVYWSALIKHTSQRIETPNFPELSLLEKLALTGE